MTENKNTATEEILKERGSIYGDVRDNMNCAAELFRVFFDYANKNPAFKDAYKDEYNRLGYRGCMDMVFHKLARIATGDPMHEDNYKDICGYTELARKIVMGETK